MHTLLEGTDISVEFSHVDDRSRLFRGIVNGLALEILVFGALWLMLR